MNGIDAVVSAFTHSTSNVLAHAFTIGTTQWTHASGLPTHGMCRLNVWGGIVHKITLRGIGGTGYCHGSFKRFFGVFGDQTHRLAIDDAQEQIVNAQLFQTSQGVGLHGGREHPSWFCDTLYHCSQRLVGLDVVQRNIVAVLEKLVNGFGRVGHQFLFGQAFQASAMLFVQLVGLARGQVKLRDTEFIDTCREKASRVPIVLVQAIVAIKKDNGHGHCCGWWMVGVVLVVRLVSGSTSLVLYRVPGTWTPLSQVVSGELTLESYFLDGCVYI